MKTTPFNLCLWSSIVTSLIGTAFAQDSATMVKIVVRDGLPEHANTFAALPKTTFLCGAEMGRIEEQEDPAHHLKELIIVNGKDMWMVNLDTDSGRHSIDHSPTNNLYFPLFMDEHHNDNVWSNELIMGHELDYMKNHSVQPTTQGDGSELYSVAISDLTYKLTTKADVPLQADIYSGDRLITRYIYDSYVKQPADLTLFSRPAGVTITEAEEHKDSAFSSMRDMGQFITNYYQSPDPSKIKDAIQFLAKNNLPIAGQDAPLRGFFQMVFVANPEKVPDWKTEISSTTGPTKDFFDKVINTGSSIDTWKELQISTSNAADNDFCWGAFFASGDERFVKVIVDRLKLIGYKTDVRKFLVGTSAQWSLASLSRQQPKVKELLQKELAAETDPEMHQAIDDALTLDPSVLKERMSSFRK